MNCYLSRNYKGLSSAGSKAKIDIEQIMFDMSFRNVGLKQTIYNNKVLAFVITLLGILKAPFCLHKGDILVLQYPLKKYYAFICNIAHFRGAKVVTIIHDLGSFRRKKLTIAREIKRLNHSDYIISHNEKMKQWLEEHHCQAKLGTLGIFDYLSTSTAMVSENVQKPFRILYAGGLHPRKNAFLYEVGAYIDFSFCLNLYGSGFEIDKVKGKEHFTYMGFVQSDDLIATAQGDFGLVWDGASVSSCVGDWGEYLQYNNPHKTSLYIRCGLPVIIWSKAALASFVREHKIGICVDSLVELNGVLSELSLQQYMEMRKNVAAISCKLSRGEFVGCAIAQAIKVLNAKE